MLSRNGWGALAAGTSLVVVAALLGYVPLAVVGCGSLSALAVSLLWVLYRPNYSASRTIRPMRVTVGDPATATLVVRNESSRRSLPLVAVERIGAGGSEIAVPLLGPGSEWEVEYELPTDRRAIVEVGPLEAPRADPFGFIRLDQRFGDIETLFVHPRRHALIPMPSSLDRSLDGPATDAASGTQMFHALREYVSGDDRRLIHWKSSARTGTLMVRQHVDTTLPNLVIVLDTDVSRQTADSFEESVEVVASIAVACVRQGFPVRIRTSDGGDFDPQGHPDPATYLLDRLAGVERKPDADIVSLTQAMRQSKGGLALVVVGALLDDLALDSVARLGQSFSSVSAVDLRPRDSSVAARRGVLRYQAESAEAFASQWNSGVVR